MFMPEIGWRKRMRGKRRCFPPLWSVDEGRSTIGDDNNHNVPLARDGSRASEQRRRMLRDNMSRRGASYGRSRPSVENSGCVARATGGRGVGGDVSSTGRGVYVPFCAGLPNLQISTTFRSVSFALPS